MFYCVPNGACFFLNCLFVILFSSCNLRNFYFYSQADLVHMGAKYTPCMRRDARIHKLIAKERELENAETGCCVGPDGCFQTSACPTQFASFYKTLNVSGRAQRVVCGQDPRYCDSPRSVKPVEWGPNITDWPVSAHCCWFSNNTKLTIIGTVIVTIVMMANQICTSFSVGQ